MATYLQMCQEVHRLIRAGNNAPGSAPTAVTGQTLMNSEIPVWVNRAWIEIQQARKEWSFLMQRKESVALASGSSTVNFANIDSNFAWVVPFQSEGGPPYILIYADADGIATQGKCYYIPYKEFAGYWDRGTLGTGKPLYFTQRPDRYLKFNATTDQAYTLTFDIRLEADSLTADSDTPSNYPDTDEGILPEFHDIIVWRAVQMYCRSRGDMGPLYGEAKDQYARLFQKLLDHYTPDPVLNLRY